MTLHIYVQYNRMCVSLGIKLLSENYCLWRLLVAFRLVSLHLYSDYHTFDIMNVTGFSVYLTYYLKEQV